jgi:thiol-disulfide isomerase/thioredoxin
MKKTFLTLLIAMFVLSCGNKEKENEADSEEIQEEIIEMEEIHPDDLPVIVGKQEITAIKSPPYTKWFMENYRYALDQSKLSSLKRALEGKTITIFMGTWCEDSRTQVPALLSILDAITYDVSKITLITMSEDKDTPEGFEVGKNIEYVPTIIVYENNVEMGRIVEYPIENLESDLLKIATGQEYTPVYSE